MIKPINHVFENKDLLDTLSSHMTAWSDYPNHSSPGFCNIATVLQETENGFINKTPSRTEGVFSFEVLIGEIIRKAATVPEILSRSSARSDRGGFGDG